MKRHSFDPISFAAGVIFLLIAGTFAFSTDFDLRLDAWLIPVSILILGIGLLAATLRTVKKPSSVDQPPSTDMDLGSEI